jgi:flagellin
MSSLLTNPSAMTALQTLTLTMKALQGVQNHISTGLRIASAADNAAYWSIATTMRSDSSVLSTITDSLHMGASTVQVANKGLQDALTVMSKIKSDLASAANPGVDRVKIQADISQQQQALRSVATSAAFNGQNWLYIDSGEAGHNYTKGIISSYSRDSSSNIDVGYILVNIAQVALIDKNLGKTVTAYSSEAMPTTAMTATGTTDGADGTSAGDTVTGRIAWDATLSQFTVTPDGSATARSIPFEGTDDNGGQYITTAFDGKKATLTHTAATTDANGNAVPENFSIKYEASGLLDRPDTSFVGTYTDSNGAITHSPETGTGASILTIDISGLADSAADLAMLNALMKHVDNVIQRMTASASDVGAMVSRTSAQQDFISSLKDTFDTGIGSLVDADMNAESNRLQALQVQQQLGIQSLSIANQSAQAILKLFG